MKIFLPLFFSLLFFACQPANYTQEPTNAHRLEGGVWRQEGKKGGYLYNFDNGLLTYQVIDFGTVLVRKEYAYRIERDTVYLTALISGTPEKWAVWVFDDSDAQITAYGSAQEPVIFRAKRQ